MPIAYRTARSIAVMALLACASGCSSSSTPGDAGTPVDSGRSTDAAVDTSGSDAGAGNDADGIDAGVRVPMYHRASDAQCTAAAPPGDCTIGGGAGACMHDADCTMGTNGRCNMNMTGAVFCRCTYDVCAHDTDCMTGQTCACHGADLHQGSNECVPGNCRVDADCGASGYCSPTIGGCGGLVGYYCHTAADTCIDDGDCNGSLQACEYDGTAMHWACTNRMFCP
jgi:hypothetical protein